jgi:probable FeS assembly SUF system protein SufT
MSLYDEVEFQRDCEVVQIPAGSSTVVPRGTRGVITQALGDTYTLQIGGGLYRLADKDADAIGKSSPRETTAAAATGPVEDQVWAELRNVYDPEIPVNIVDLGLVYDMRVVPTASGSRRVEVKMTLTAQGCGMGPSIAMDAQRRIESLPEVEEADVQVVWDPPWGPQMISPEGRTKLGLS